jgi:hypothetical protein
VCRHLEEQRHSGSCVRWLSGHLEEQELYVRCDRTLKKNL